MDPIGRPMPKSMNLETDPDKFSISSLFWDYEVSEEELQALLDNKIYQAGIVSRQRLFVRILESWSWYTILKNLDRSILQELLTDPVLMELRDEQLRENYLYARQVLSK